MLQPLVPTESSQDKGNIPVRSRPEENYTEWKPAFNVQSREKIETVTKRNILSRLAKIYDPMRLASPLLLQGKQIYREVCDSKVP